MRVQRYFRLRGLLPAFVGLVLAIPNVTVASTIGLYADASGSSCNFVGNDAGMLTAYVVIKPDGDGLKSVRFSVPVPPCLGATFLYDQVPDGMTASGSSPTGVALNFPFCADEPALALTVNYYRASTTPCCEFVIAPDPFVGAVEGIDCSFGAATLFALTSHVNPDATCRCGNPPPPPFNPGPPHNATAVSVFTGFSWLPLETDFIIDSYDVYLGTDPAPPLVATVTQSSYQPPLPLDEFAQYYWRIVIRDEVGAEIPGPTWAFTTRATNSPPPAPANYDPPNGATGVPVVNAHLRWSASVDIDGDAVEYDVYFGTAADPPLIASYITVPQYTLPALSFVTSYWWRVVARDSQGHETTGPVATFVTRPENFPPYPPSSPNPANNATFRPLNLTLSWSASDADPGDVLHYDVYLGTSNTPPLIASNLSTKSKSVSGLVAGTDYHWKVVARDNHGAETSGELWTFRTNAYPYPPSDPSPGDGATGLPLIVTITWEGSDPDGEPVTFDLFWGPQSPPTALRQSNLATPSADIGGLTFLQTVYWRIRIRDSHGATTLGPVWSFTTGANSPPTQASDPAPENNGYAGSATSLQWGAATDPNTLPSYLVYFGTTNPPPYLAAILDTQFETGAFEAGLQYFWRIDVSDGTVVTTGELWAFHGGSQPTVVEPVPTVLTLGRNHPNPFNPQTIIPYSVPAGKTVRVRMTIFDTAGSVVRVLLDEDQNGGAREVVWKGDDDRGATVSSGVYYCVLHVGDERRTQKLVLLK